MTAPNGSTGKKSKHIGKRLRKVRELLGVRQVALAEQTGLTQQYISKLERSRFIPETVLKKLGEGLGVTTELIRNFDEEKAILNVPALNNFRGSMDKVVELFSRILLTEREKLELQRTKIDLLSRTNEELIRINKSLPNQTGSAPKP